MTRPSICSVEHCAGRHVARGYCNKHYTRWKKHGDPRHNLFPHLVAKRKPTANELYWAAGFIEGEGGFDLNKNNCLTLKVAQVEKEPLLLLQEIFGGYIGARRHKKHAHHKPFFVWSISGARARGVVLTLFGLFFSKRRAQIKAALAAAA